MKPKLFVSSLTNRIYIGLTYHENPNGTVVCTNKIDVTKEFIAIMRNYKPYVRGGNYE